MADATRAMAGTMGPEAATVGASAAMGYGIVCIIPAVFWTVVTALVGWIAGYELSGATLAGIAATIAAFLAIVFSALAMPRRAA